MPDNEEKPKDLLADAEPPTNEHLQIIDGMMVWSVGDGVSLVCQYNTSSRLWKYHVVRGGVAISRVIASPKAPYEDDSRVRDLKLKMALANANGVDVDAAMRGFEEFGIYLMQDDAVLESFITSLDDSTPPEEVDEALRARASEILMEDDPVRFVMGTFHSIHIGDDDYGRLLMLAIASQHVRNTHGIHLTPSGESGKGKSHAGKTMLHLVPKDYWLAASLSPKALYYYGVDPGTIIFSDDVTLTEDLLSIIRRCITGFTESQEHITVSKDREGTKLLMPPRIIWIIASVENFLDAQTRNRMVDVPVDESAETDELVFQKQVEDAKTAADEFPETEDVRVCRELFRIIKQLDPMPVLIPYADDINWKIKSNRRNFDVFKDLIKSYAVMRHLQRDKDDEGRLAATLDDFYDAKDLYLHRAEGEMTKLTRGELDVIRMLADHGECTVSMLQKMLHLSKVTIQRRLKGRDDKNGLLDKVPELTVENRTDKIGDSQSHREWFSMSNFDRFAQYLDIVSLKSDDEIVVNGAKDVSRDMEVSCDSSIEVMMGDAHDWWFDYTKEHDALEYIATEYLEYLILKEPKYNTKKRKDALLWILGNKKDGAEGWLNGGA